MAIITSSSLFTRSIYITSVKSFYILLINISFFLSSAISSKNIYLCDDGRVLLDNFSHCISMVSPYDGKIRRQIYDYTDDLKDEILYLAPEIIYQVCKIFKITKKIEKFYLFRMQMVIILKVIFIA